MAKLFIPMKIRNNAKDNEKFDLEDLTVETRFGRTPYFMLIDSDSMKYEIIPNSNHHYGGRDSPVMIASKYNANVVLAAHMGHGPYVDFKSNHISVYQVGPNMSIKSAIEMFNSDELSQMKLPDIGTCCSGGKH
ncbi:MAG: NifB/NifX family molybdenum-iron cluster-binding protein [Candidatus Kariarchaeaceae archaeon]|jgi:predicted Fe-Mo cluster-binding NifX family protein